MRRAAAIDQNQLSIVQALRSIPNVSVQLLSRVGAGCPDLLIGHYHPTLGRRNLLAEVKDGSKAPSARALTAAQVEWHRSWRGQVTVVASVSEALALIGIEVSR